MAKTKTRRANKAKPTGNLKPPTTTSFYQDEARCGLCKKSYPSEVRRQLHNTIHLRLWMQWGLESARRARQNGASLEEARDLARGTKVVPVAADWLTEVRWTEMHSEAEEDVPRLLALAKWNALTRDEQGHIYKALLSHAKYSVESPPIFPL